MSENRSTIYPRSFALLWLAFVLLIVLALAFLLPVTPNDYWWYVRVGQEIMRMKAIPTVDTFTFTRNGSPVTYHSWLSAVIFWLLYAAGGVPSTVLLRGIVIALAYASVWLTARQAAAGPKLASLFTLLAVLAGSNNWAVRPQMFTYPLFAWSLWILWRWDRGKTGGIWFLPLIGALWVNLHGSFILLFLLAGAALIFGRGDRRSLALATGATLLATWINPRGIGSAQYVLDMLTSPSNQRLSVEWSPPLNSGWQMNLFFAWILAFALLAAFSSRRLSRLEAAWFLLFGWLALSGERYGIWFLFILTVLSASLLADWGRAWLDRPVYTTLPVLNAILIAALLLMPLALLPDLRDAWWPQAPPALSENTPVAATEWLSAHPELPGPLWSDLTFSSYLIFMLPSRPAWIDTRFEVFPVEQWERYQEIADAAPRWNDLLDEEGINLLMISVKDQPRLLLALEGWPGWCEQYRDNTAAIFSRKVAGQECK